MQSKTAYITKYPADTCDPTEPSQAMPMPAGGLQEARHMFKGMPVAIDNKRMIVFDVGDGQRLALTDYAIK